MSSEDLVVRVTDLESNHGFVLEHFLSSLRGNVIFASDQSFAIDGGSIVYSLSSHRARMFDPLSQIGVMSLTYQGRQLFGPPLVHLEGQGH